MLLPPAHPNKTLSPITKHKKNSRKKSSNKTTEKLISPSLAKLAGKLQKTIDRFRSIDKSDNENDEEISENVNDISSSSLPHDQLFEPPMTSSQIPNEINLDVKSKKTRKLYQKRVFDFTTKICGLNT